MTDVRVTQEAVEVLITNQRPSIRMTQQAVEVICTSARPSLRLTQVALEVLRSADIGSEPLAPRRTLLTVTYS